MGGVRADESWSRGGGGAASQVKLRLAVKQQRRPGSRQEQQQQQQQEQEQQQQRQQQQQQRKRETSARASIEKPAKTRRLSFQPPRASWNLAAKPRGSLEHLCRFGPLDDESPGL